MSYIEELNEKLLPAKIKHWLALDLFAGCGGLASGFEAQGFETIGYEMQDVYCRTYNRNLSGLCLNEILTPDYKFPSADIVIGGPPCQPFSVGGYQKGLQDSRNGFPTFLSAIKQIHPRLALFENVRGLMYRNKWYLEEIVNELEGLGYSVEFELLNAAHYGVPQNRERLIAIAAQHKGVFKFPSKSKHMVSAGEALGDMVFQAPPDGKYLTPSMDTYVGKYEKASKCKTPRDLHLEKPARTLTCGNLARATGDMHRIVLPDGRRRRLSVREAARLQSFPDHYEFLGSETKQYNQIGNAVPPLLAYQLASSVRDYLKIG
jgi:DNA (cytosine-5)-methyltransferase 1